MKLTDLIDIRTLQEIQDGFAAATGMAALTTDADGVAVTKGSNFTDFCMKLTRCSVLGKERCEKCDRDGGCRSMQTGSAVTYVCHGGLVDFAAPIMLNGEMIGSFIGGQVLIEPLDEPKMRGIAAELGIDPDEYIRAARKVNVIPKAKVDAAAKFLHTIANTLSRSAYATYISEKNNLTLEQKQSVLIDKINKASSLVEANTKSMNELKNRFDELDRSASASVSRVKSTTETVKVIQDIALNTRILGFNASIEASRAKESGKGFGVIAQEVRKLAETSKVSADKIEDTVKNIGISSETISENIKETKKVVEDSLDNMKQFTEVLNEIQNFAV